MAHAAKNVFTGVSKKGGGGGEVDGRGEVGKGRRRPLAA